MWMILSAPVLADPDQRYAIACIRLVLEQATGVPGFVKGFRDPAYFRWRTMIWWFRPDWATMQDCWARWLWRQGNSD